jgi:hypothetical protein
LNPVAQSPRAFAVEGSEEIATPRRRFNAIEVTSGLPDDSLEGDERQAERRLRDLRERVELARSMVSRTPGLAETLTTDWQKAARFYARFAISEALFRDGVPAGVRVDRKSAAEFGWESWQSTRP